MNVRVCVLTGFGINCDYETAHAFRVAGAATERIHLNDLISEPEAIGAFHILAVPGGFSFGDDVASGRILANRMRYKLGEPLDAFISSGKLMIGICNGFQVLVKMGVLPMFDGEIRQTVTLTHNDSGRFENRWVALAVDPAASCVWTDGLTEFELPVRHGEGKFIARDEAVLQRLRSGGHVALRYCLRGGAPARGQFPANPNGSMDDIAGICDASGRILGLMPHPEAHISPLHHPRWTREDLPGSSPGLTLLRNGVDHARAHLLPAHTQPNG